MTDELVYLFTASSKMLFFPSLQLDADSFL